MTSKGWPNEGWSAKHMCLLFILIRCLDISYRQQIKIKFIVTLSLIHATATRLQLLDADTINLWAFIMTAGIFCNNQQPFKTS